LIANIRAASRPFLAQSIYMRNDSSKVVAISRLISISFVMGIFLPAKSTAVFPAFPFLPISGECLQGFVVTPTLFCADT
jgi:hypothetical protein